MNFNKVIYSFERNGIIGAINVIFGKLGIKYRIKNAIDSRIYWLGKQIKKITLNTVQSGPYKGMKLSNDVFWNEKDISSKLIGCYEKEVQEEIEIMQKIYNKKYLINLGGGEGYHAIGALKSDLFKKIIVFEKEDVGQKIIKKNASLNNLENNIIVEGNSTKSFLSTNVLSKINLEECSFLIDIEGDEFEILDEDNLTKMSKSNMILEFHENQDHNYENINEKFINLLKKHFKIKFITTSSRDLSKFKFLEKFEDIDRWLLVSENRPVLMSWIICVPLK